MMSIAGHASKKMLQHYSHIRLDATRIAGDRLKMKPDFRSDSKGKGEGYGTIKDTNAL